MSEKTWVDIGHDVQIDVRRIDGELYGVGYRHKRPDTGEQCEGYAPVQGPGELWALHSEEPMTISPSLLCLACGHHGFIRDGKWVPA